VANWDHDHSRFLDNVSESIQQSQLGNRFEASRRGTRVWDEESGGWVQPIETQLMRRPSTGIPSDLSKIRDANEREAINAALEVLFFGAHSPQEQARIMALYGDSAALHFESANAGVTRGGQYGTRSDQGRLNTRPIIATDAISELVEIPTSTMDTSRPRTIAAAYDPEKETLTLVFRDGTFYNYYDVDSALWKSFRSQASKGRFIKNNLDGQPRGPADMSSMNEYTRELLVKTYQVAQIRYSGSAMPKKFSRVAKASPVLQPNIKTWRHRQKTGKYK
jgi:hypothetical protein